MRTINFNSFIVIFAKIFSRESQNIYCCYSLLLICCTVVRTLYIVYIRHD